jgi:predicted phage tail protein
MPVRVQLSNFGSQARADTTATFSVLDSNGREVVTEKETVAVETTSTFTHSLMLPPDISPGHYEVQVSIVYQGQQAPAVSSYQFSVERKFAGIFVSDLLKYGLIALLSILFVLGLVWIFEKYQHSTQSHEYSHIPQQTRVYYEIVSDIIYQMRLHEGDAALRIAQETPGLKIDEDGKVTMLAGDPAAIVASLVSEYKNAFGKKVNLCFGKRASCKAIVKSPA